MPASTVATVPRQVYDQLLVDHHLTLSYLYELQTRLQEQQHQQQQRPSSNNLIAGQWFTTTGGGLVPKPAVDQKPTTDTHSNSHHYYSHNNSEEQLQQKVADEHLMLSYAVEAQTRVRDAQSLADAAAAQKVVDDHLALSYVIETRTRALDAENTAAVAAAQKVLDDHLALSYFVESQTRARDDAAAAAVAASQKVVDEHLALSYMLEAMTLARDLDYERAQRAAQEVVDGHLALSYLLEAATIQRTTSTETPVSDSQKTVDDHLNLSYVLEAQTRARDAALKRTTTSSPIDADEDDDELGTLVALSRRIEAGARRLSESTASSAWDSSPHHAVEDEAAVANLMDLVARIEGDIAMLGPKDEPKPESGLTVARDASIERSAAHDSVDPAVVEHLLALSQQIEAASASIPVAATTPSAADIAQILGLVSRIETSIDSVTKSPVDQDVLSHMISIVAKIESDLTRIESQSSAAATLPAGYVAVEESWLNRIFSLVQVVEDHSVAVGKAVEKQRLVAAKSALAAAAPVSTSRGIPPTPGARPVSTSAQGDQHTLDAHLLLSYRTEAATLREQLLLSESVADAQRVLDSHLAASYLLESQTLLRDLPLSDAQKVVDDHLSLSYRIEAATRLRDQRNQQNTADSHLLLSYRLEAETLRRAADADDPQRVVDDHLALSYRIEAATRLRDQIAAETKKGAGLKNRGVPLASSPATADALVAGDAQKTVDDHLALSYRIEAATRLRDQTIVTEGSGRPTAALTVAGIVPRGLAPRSPATPTAQRTADAHLLLSHQLEAATVSRDIQRMEAMSAAQATVDSHLSLSYRLEAETLRHGFEADEAQNVVDDHLAMSYRVEAATRLRDQLDRASALELQRIVDEHLALSYRIEAATRLRDQIAAAARSDRTIDPAAYDQMVVDLHLAMSYLIEFETIKRDDAEIALSRSRMSPEPVAVASHSTEPSTSAHRRSSSRYSDGTVVAEPIASVPEGKILVDMDVFQRLVKEVESLRSLPASTQKGATVVERSVPTARSVGKTATATTSTSTSPPSSPTLALAALQVHQATVDHHFIQSFAHDLKAMSQECVAAAQEMLSKRQSLADPSQLRAALHLPSTPFGETTLPAEIAHHVAFLRTQIQRTRDLETRLFDTEARLRARDQYLQNTIMETARRVQELEQQTADLDAQNEELRDELKRAKEDREQLKNELGDLEEDHLALQNELVVGEAAVAAAAAAAVVVVQETGDIVFADAGVATATGVDVMDDYVVLRDVETQTDAAGLISLMASGRGMKQLPASFDSSADAIAAIESIRRERSDSGSSGGSTEFPPNTISGSVDASLKALSLSNRLTYATLIATTQAETITELEALLRQKDISIETLTAEIAELEIRINVNEEELNDRQHTIALLQERLAMMEQERTAEWIRRRVEDTIKMAARTYSISTQTDFPAGPPPAAPLPPTPTSVPAIVLKMQEFRGVSDTNGNPPRRESSRPSPSADPTSPSGPTPAVALALPTAPGATSPAAAPTAAPVSAPAPPVIAGPPVFEYAVPARKPAAAANNRLSMNLGYQSAGPVSRRGSIAESVHSVDTVEAFADMYTSAASPMMQPGNPFDKHQPPVRPAQTPAGGADTSSKRMSLISSGSSTQGSATAGSVSTAISTAVSTSHRLSMLGAPASGVLPVAKPATPAAAAHMKPPRYPSPAPGVSPNPFAAQPAAPLGSNPFAAMQHQQQQQQDEARSLVALQQQQQAYTLLQQQQQKLLLQLQQQHQEQMQQLASLRARQAAAAAAAGLPGSVVGVGPMSPIKSPASVHATFWPPPAAMMPGVPAAPASASASSITSPQRGHSPVSASSLHGGEWGRVTPMSPPQAFQVGGGNPFVNAGARASFGAANAGWP
ncbi:hypothetical protein DFJ73DRAFT_757828 [Zopfochytrium polystomum]|nr:hypothetical protein DFJ73DRAFT_757828 [Zopfochytrium polystomum]